MANYVNTLIKNLGIRLSHSDMEDPAKKAQAVGIELDPKRCPWVKLDRKQCKNMAGKGTDHPGQGCCKWHRGDGRPKIHGRRSKYNYPSLRDKMEAYKTDEKLKSTDDEIARLKVMQEEVEEFFAKNMRLSQDEIEEIKGVNAALGKRLAKFNIAFSELEKISKLLEVILATDRLVSSKHNREVGQKYTLTIENIHLIFGQIAHHADRICKGCQRRKALADAIEESVIPGR